MLDTDITVIIAAHPARARGGLLSRALTSVMNQTFLPAAVVVAMDLEKQGAAVTRHRALQGVQTPWTAVIDSDDVWMPNHLQVLMGTAQREGADFVYSGFETLPPGNRIFPETHFTNDFNPEDPIETTVTVLVRTRIAQAVGYHSLDRGETNSGEDFRFMLSCLHMGAKIVNAKQKTWMYDVGTRGQNTSGLPTRGDARS